MKSFQVEYMIRPSEQPRYSDLCTLKSAAGWYVGTTYKGEDGFIEPGSRDTDYYPSESDAKLSLAILEKCHQLSGAISGVAIPMWRGVMKSLDMDKRGVGYRLTP